MSRIPSFLEDEEIKPSIPLRQSIPQASEPFDYWIIVRNLAEAYHLSIEEYLELIEGANIE